MSFSNVFKKILALILVAYFSIFSPVVALAVVTQPVSAPISIPVPVPDPTPTPTPIPSPKPDLTISLSANVNIGSTAPSSIAIVKATVKNTGNVKADTSVTSIAVSPGTNPAWRMSTKALNPGESQELTITHSVSSGKYDYTATADADSQVNEEKEDNNQAFASVTITAPKPDLVVTLSANVNIGTTVPLGIGTTASTSVVVTANVYNIGNVKADPSVTSIAVSQTTNPVWRLGTKALNPGESQQLQITQFISTPGTYQYTAITDADSQVAESKEDNNSATTTVVIPSPKPDLVVEKVNVLGKHQVGSKDEIEITVKNGGNADVNSKVGAGVFVYDPQGRKVEDFLANMEEIKASSSNTRRFSLNNNYQAAGSYKVVITADYFNYISESNEQNNSYTTSVNVSQAAVINQSIINFIWPYQLRVGRYIVLWGSNFGASGKINFYLKNQTAALGSSRIYNWSNSFIFGQVPSNLSANQQFSIQVATSDSRVSPLTYRYISR